MNIVVVYAHPDPKSFNRAILDAVVKEIGDKGHDCSVRDLYELQFQPALTLEDIEEFNRGRTPSDIGREQEAIRAADVVFFIHPVWWFGIPAILKGWVDRVFSYGFAYGHDSKGVKPLLIGKKAVIINTTGGAEGPNYDVTGFKDALVRLNDVGIYKFVGFDVILHRIFYQIPTVTNEVRLEMLESLRADLHRLI